MIPPVEKPEENYVMHTSGKSEKKEQIFGIRPGRVCISNGCAKGLGIFRLSGIPDFNTSV
jgi:hypothetical protein